MLKKKEASKSIIVYEEGQRSPVKRINLVRLRYYPKEKSVNKKIKNKILVH